MNPEENSSDEQIRTKTSSDGVDYRTRMTPCKVELDPIEYSEHPNLTDADGFPVYHLYIKCQELKEKLLPLEANPREPSKSRQVQAMQETLEHGPEDFVKKNNGMTILCSRVERVDNGAVKVEFDHHREGVCNGGHTYFAILSTQFKLDPKAIVHLELIQVPDSLKGEARREEIVGIARARNNTNSLEERSEADFLNYYDKFKDRMHDSSVVSWHEGDSEAYPYAVDAPHLIRLLWALNPQEFVHRVFKKKGTHHKQAARSKSKYHTKWFEGAADAHGDNKRKDPLYFLSPLIDDVFLIRDMLSHSLKHDELGGGFRKSSLYQDYISKGGTRELHIAQYSGEEGYDLNGPFEVMLTGLFRSNVWLYAKPDDVLIDYVGWVKSPRSLWDQRKIEVLESIKDYFQEAGKDPSEFTKKSAPYEQSLYRYAMDPDLPKPEILWSVASGQKYRACSEEEATHGFSVEHGDGILPLEEFEGEDWLYRETD